MAILRACIEKMKPYIPGEMADDPRIVKLNQNENRYPPSPRVAEAVAAALPSLALYPESTSLHLRRAAAEVFGVRPEEVIAANGSDEMLLMLYQACCNPGDEAVGFNPGYTFYATLAAKCDVRYRLIDLEGEFALPARPDLKGAKLVFVTNPNAQTGTLFPERDVRRLIESVPDGLVAIDEAYADFAGVSAIPLVREYPNVVVVRTFSKSYALAGLRVGLGFANESLLAQLEKVRDFYNIDRLAQAGAEAALRDGEWLARTTAKIVAARDRAVAATRALGLKVHDSAANFFLIRFPSAERAAAVFRRLRDNRVYVRYFGQPGLADCIRVSVGTDADMDIFAKELEKAVRSIP